MNMFPAVIGINEKFLNLNSIALVEDQSDGTQSKALIITSDGAEIEVFGEDADLLFDRMELVSFASDSIFATLQKQFDAARPSVSDRTDDNDS